jgi:glycosyltransferase involved in cell wall biosynthesis
MHKVSVIVPNYNHAPYLHDRINSVLDQTFQDFELVLMDDCSSDNSREIMERYRDHPKVSQLVFNEKNSGNPFEQWEKGISLTSGEYIWIAESDDWCSRDFLDTAMEALQKSENLSLFFSRSYQIDQANAVLNDLLWWTADLPKYDWEKNFTEQGVDLIRNCLIKKNVIVNASAVVFRRGELRDHFSKISRLRKNGDWLFWTLLLLKGEVAYHGIPLNYFRDHQGSTRNYSTIDSHLLNLVEQYYVRSKILELTNGQNSNAVLNSYELIFISTPVLKYQMLRRFFNRILRKNLSFGLFIYKRYQVKVKRRLIEIKHGFSSTT